MSHGTAHAASERAEDIAHALTDPNQHDGNRTSPQSLAAGAAGIALLHTERAASGHGHWPTARTWLTTAINSESPIAGDGAGLFFGAPACGFAAHVAARARPGILSHALAQLDASITALTHQRLDAAHARIDRGEFTMFGEYDLMRGLTGLGAYHLQRDHRDSIRAVLSYLVRLTRTRNDGLPGWWVKHAPTPGDPHAEFACGHANLGMAHGITGPLALLALAMRYGFTVDGHTEAIERICAWLDVWQQPHSTGSWWPYWITRSQAHDDAPVPGPGRPSWCYGTPGLARAQQLAGLALNNRGRQHTAEAALLGSVTDPDQIASLREPGLCHGLAGLVQTTRRMAADADTEELAEHLPRLSATLIEYRHAESPEFLTGAAGVALTLHSAESADPDFSVWDTSLLLS